MAIDIGIKIDTKRANEMVFARIAVSNVSNHLAFIVERFSFSYQRRRLHTEELQCK